MLITVPSDHGLFPQFVDGLEMRYNRCDESSHSTLSLPQSLENYRGWSVFAFAALPYSGRCSFRTLYVEATDRRHRLSSTP